MTQAEKVIQKFGGARALADAINRDKSSIHRWARDGLIPRSAVNEVLKAAARLAVTLTAEDWRP